MSATAAAQRVAARVDGVVQGVGFRPFAFRLAAEHGLGGFVRNDERGVLLEVEGAPEAVERFLAELVERAPPLARVERVTTRSVPARGERTFAIRHSARAAGADALVPADVATCDDCLRELFDPADRRHRYPFVNCTNCGPRFTIVDGVPYDRPLTTMAAFVMCDACRAEYEDPRDRRFHAQPNACPECGPRLSLPLEDAVGALRGGAIVAVKGLGGFHLACLADVEEAVARLRARKHREDRPFALMCGSVEAARELVRLGPAEEALVCSPARPIVLAPRAAGARVAAAVAPRSRDLGVMLPYTPLHHLLLHDAGRPLVMTSGNVSDEPIAYRDEDALARLRGIADLFLLHDRPIRTRTDDSVVRAIGHTTAPLLIRRSRGYVPESLALPLPAPVPLLACGAELKSTFCVAKGERAWVSHHIGDLENYETLTSFVEGIAHFEPLFAVAPRVVAHDLHPEYLSTKYALAREDAETLAVQHHHAHMAACLAEHGERGPAVGAIFDGTGYGDDGTIWGGELLLGDLERFERAGHLWPVGLPGGAQAIREPWRMACAWLVEAQGDEGPPLPGVEARAWHAVAALARSTLSPATTSAGRLFDAVAALCGLRLRVTYEGQAAAELEAACDPHERGSYPLPLTDGLVLDARATIRAVAADVAAGAGPPLVAARFHNALATATAGACAALASRSGLGTVALGGGAFQNRRLLEAVAGELRRLGLRALVPERLPPNDGGISYGQAAVAAARLAAGEGAPR